MVNVKEVWEKLERNQRIMMVVGFLIAVVVTVGALIGLYAIALPKYIDVTLIPMWIKVCFCGIVAYWFIATYSVYIAGVVALYSQLDMMQIMHKKEDEHVYDILGELIKETAKNKETISPDVLSR